MQECPAAHEGSVRPYRQGGGTCATQPGGAWLRAGLDTRTAGARCSFSRRAWCGRVWSRRQPTHPGPGSFDGAGAGRPAPQNTPPRGARSGPGRRWPGFGLPERSNSCSDHRADAVANQANSWASLPLAAILSSRSRIARTRARRSRVKLSPAGTPVSSGPGARLALRSVSAASRSALRFRAATDRAAMSLEFAVSNRGIIDCPIPPSPRQARP